MVAILGKGDSLFGQDLSKIDCEIWGLNDIVKTFRCDKQISWDKIPQYTDAKLETLKVHGGKWINEGNYLRRKPGYVANFNSSLMFAINIAIQEGHKEIYLLGFDNKINHTKFYTKYNEATYRNLFNLINRWAKIFEMGLKDEKIYVVEGGINAFEHISYSELYSCF